MKRHIQHSYYVEGEGLWTFDDAQQPRCISPVAPAEVRMFRFSRLGPRGEVTDPDSTTFRMADLLMFAFDNPADLQPPRRRLAPPLTRIQRAQRGYRGSSTPPSPLNAAPHRALWKMTPSTCRSPVCTALTPWRICTR